MNEIIGRINPIYEAIRYLKSRANCFSVQRIADTAASYYPSLRETISKLLEIPLQLERILDSEISVNNEELVRYFGTESFLAEDYSLAQLLLEPITYCGFITDANELVNALVTLPEEQKIHRFACAMKQSDMTTDIHTYMELVDYVLSMDAESDEKVMTLDFYNHYGEHLTKVMELIKPVAECIERNEAVYKQSVANWLLEIQAIGSFDDFLSEKYHLRCPQLDYKIFPSLFQGLLFTISFWNKPPVFSAPGYGEIAVSIAMIPYLNAIPGESNTSRIVAIIKGLSDETRFELLQHISRRPCYSNALAEMFNMPHQKVFYHMTKLLAPNIVNADVRSGKTYYSLNRRTIMELIDTLNQLLEASDKN